MRSCARIASHPIHPMLIGLPLGMWFASWIFDLLFEGFKNPSFGNTGYYLAIAGCIGALCAAIPGLLDWISVVPPNSSGKKTGAAHASLNTAALLLFFFVALARRGFVHDPTNLTLLLSTIGIVLLCISGWLGGSLSYDLQIGVYRRQTQGHPLMERTIAGFNYPACNQSELADGQMMLIHNQGPESGRRIVLGKTAEGYYAFSDHCTHKGGPLCDGVLAGSAVQCPWHGSQFDVHTGRVISGPADKPIEIFGVALHGGEIYLTLPARYAEKKAS